MANLSQFFGGSGDEAPASVIKSIQHGSSYIRNGYRYEDVNITPVDLSKSFLVMSHNGSVHTCGVFSSSSQLRFSRDSTSNYTSALFMVVEYV